MKALTPERGSAVTLIFTSALRIFYPAVNNDPIFPADETFDRFKDGSELWYYKSDPKARVIGCVDRNEMCTENGTTCWTLEDEPAEIRLPSEYWFMKFALAKATIYDAIQTRLGDALIAQEMVTGYQSRDLVADPDHPWKLHWMRETERLFQTSLARIQFDAWSIGSGEDEKRVLNDGYSNYTDVEAGNLCGLFKFKSTQYSNILVGWYIGLLFLLPALWILATEVTTIKSRYLWTVNHICCWGSKSRRDTTSLQLLNDNPDRSADGTEDSRQTEDRTVSKDETEWKPLVIHWLLWNLPLLAIEGTCYIASRCWLMVECCLGTIGRSSNQGIARQNVADNF
jgi:hypothetical protein